MLVALAQLDMGYENIDYSKQKIANIINKASKKHARMVIFPEMTFTGFTMNHIADPTIPPFMEQLSKEYQIAIIYGYIEEGYYNALDIVDQGSILAHYRKIHPFLKESNYYLKGEEIVSATIDNLTFVPTICYDLRFPILYYLARKKGNIIINIASWPDSRDEHWLALLKARAIENQCIMIGVNRVGNDPNNHYIGHSVVFDGWGNQLNPLYEDERIIYVDIKELEYPARFIDDQREELYLKLLENKE